jgi:uncharacterized protein YegJ (DUF2314 family)
MGESPIFFHKGDDPEMLRAHEQARATFRYFWRELTWERQRIVPGLSMAAVKAPFSDGDGEGDGENPGVEHMWIDEVDFDGQTISGVLLNDPNWLKSVSAGDGAFTGERTERLDVCDRQRSLWRLHRERTAGPDGNEGTGRA